MKEEEKLIRALKELAAIAERNEAERVEERKSQMEKAERRKRLYKLYYEQAPPISLSFPKDSEIFREENDQSK